MTGNDMSTCCLGCDFHLLNTNPYQIESEGTTVWKDFLSMARPSNVMLLKSL